MRSDFSVKHYAKGGGAWTRKEGQNPEGGLLACATASVTSFKNSLLMGDGNFWDFATAKGLKPVQEVI